MKTYSDKNLPKGFTPREFRRNAVRLSKSWLEGETLFVHALEWDSTIRVDDKGLGYVMPAAGAGWSRHDAPGASVAAWSGSLSPSETKPDAK